MEQVDCIVMPFDGSSVEVIKDSEGQTWVSVRSICKAIGVDNARQQTKLDGDPKFRCRHMSTPSAGGPQVMVCIALEHLNAWLFSINSKRVREDVRPRLLAYQQECSEVLYSHFMPRGESDMAAFMSEMRGMRTEVREINSKFSYLVGVDSLVFGNDADVIKGLIEQLAVAQGVTANEAWGYVKRECDVASYKMQNRKIINFIKKELGQGLTLIKGGL